MPRSRIVLFLLASALGLVLLSACGSDSAETVDTTADIASNDDHDDEDHDDEDPDDHEDEDHDDHDDHDDEGSAGLGAHVHGSAELFVAWSSGDVVVDLISPANNVFGFEYEPVSDEDLSVVDAQTEALAAPGLLKFTAEAGCVAAGDVESELEYEGTHSEVTTSWMFTCAEPAELRELDLTALFTAFPGFEDIDAQWASADTQSAAELSPSSPVIRFE